MHGEITATLLEEIGLDEVLTYMGMATKEELMEMMVTDELLTIEELAMFLDTFTSICLCCRKALVDETRTVCEYCSGD